MRGFDDNIKFFMNKQLDAWQVQLIEAIDNIAELKNILQLDDLNIAQAHSDFPLKVPMSYIRRMQPKNPQDPLLLQILPQVQESQVIQGYEKDPLHETQYNPLPGLIHKYHGRVLLTLTGVCSVNCRYCFRRYFSYAENNPGKAGWEKVFNYLAQNPSIEEVILSGGDPLMLPDRMLHSFIEQLESIQHIKRLRIHSRLPVVLPERLTPNLIQVLTHHRLEKILVTHSNHPQELDESVADALKPLRGIVTLLNQTVLLKNINNQVEILINLSKKLFSIGILPYYLHVLDKVAGAAHFDIPLSEAKNLWNILLENLPKITWIRFIVWTIIGIFLYFGYGIKHSVLNKKVFKNSNLSNPNF